MVSLVGGFGGLGGDLGWWGGGGPSFGGFGGGFFYMAVFRTQGVPPPLGEGVFFSLVLFILTLVCWHYVSYIYIYIYMICPQPLVGTTRTLT
jgi:hypothetical protein